VPQVGRCIGIKAHSVFMIAATRRGSAVGRPWKLQLWPLRDFMSASLTRSRMRQLVPVVDAAKACRTAIRLRLKRNEAVNAGSTRLQADDVKAIGRLRDRNCLSKVT
jgi:hypothetical protein